MNDVAHIELEPQVREALRAYNAPPAPPLDDMWRSIEQAHFGATVHTLPVTRRRWMPTGLAVAAALVLGVAIGQFGPLLTGDSRNVPTLLSPVANTQHESAFQPIDASYSMTANRYLGETAALLAVLPGVANIQQEGLAQQTDAHYAAQAAELLSTTRMLLDSPASEDKELNALLSDLELVLAQVATLSPTRSAEELKLITAAVQQRDMLPRLQQAVLRTADMEPMASGGVRKPGEYDHSM